MLPLEHSAILSTCIKLPPVFKTFILSIFEWPLKTSFFDKSVPFYRPQYAKVVEHVKCTGTDQVDKELKRIIALGGEGLMIRQPGSKYERTRSKTLLKIKKFHDAEVRINHFLFLKCTLTCRSS